jgi:ketosteroid isomerase-like protein
MPRGRCVATVRAMVRMVLVIAVLGVAFVLLRERIMTSGSAAPVQATVDTSRVPKEFRSLLAYRPDPAAILSSRGALPGLGVIRRLAGHGSDAPATDQMRPFGDVGTRREVRQVERHIHRDIDALNRLSETRGVTPAAAERTLELVYSAATLDALGPDGRQAFAARVAGTTHASQKIKVLDFDGVFVAGDRALAQVVYRLSIRAPSGRFVARAPATWTVTLAREGGRWRFVRGIEAT